MTMDATLLAVAALFTVLVSWGIVALLIRLAPRIGLVDRPNQRSLHTRVTPRGGGLGFVFVLLLAVGLFVACDGGWFSPDPAGELRRPLAIYVGAALFIAAISLWDDFKSLSPALRLGCQLLAAFAAAGGVAYFTRISVPGFAGIELGWMGAALTIIWIVGLTNVYNFMDGIDGIAGVQALTAGLAWAVAGMWSGSAAVTLVGALLACGSLGFLFHNWSPAKIFMGDVGSAFLGYSFAVLPLLALRESAFAGSINVGLVPVFAVLLVWPFLADGFFTFVRRARQGEAVWRPHRSHLYQRLVQCGWPHARVSALYAGWGVLSAASGLFWIVRAGDFVALLAVAASSLGSFAVVLALVNQQERRVRSKHV